jgi:hypothetical protein
MFFTTNVKNVTKTAHFCVAEKTQFKANFITMAFLIFGDE